MYKKLRPLVYATFSVSFTSSSIHLLFRQIQNIQHGIDPRLLSVQPICCPYRSSREGHATTGTMGNLDPLTHASKNHGVVANDSWKSEIDSALGAFLSNRDVAGFQAALVAAEAANA